MTHGRGKTTLISMAVLTLCVVMLALPVAAQVTRGGSMRGYEQVRRTPMITTVLNLRTTYISEPSSLALLGIVLTISARIARRRLLS